MLSRHVILKGLVDLVKPVNRIPSLLAFVARVSSHQTQFVLSAGFDLA
jgi:hypothetical protein